MKRRVVVTGVGLVTPLGVGVDVTWDALCAGKSGIAEITHFDTTDYPTKIAGEVKNFRGEDWLTVKDAKRTELFIAYAVAATRMAVEDSGLKIDESNAHRVGVITGCGLGGLQIMERHDCIGHDSGAQARFAFLHPHVDREHGTGYDLDLFRR